MNAVTEVTEVTATPNLMHLAGVLNAARVDLQRVERSAADYPVLEYPEVLQAARDELTTAEHEYYFEYQAQAALEELAAPVAKIVASKPQRTRCPHWKLIKRFFTIAREAGLDTSKEAKPKMRHALENAMGRCVNSRSEVTAGKWEKMGDLIKSKRLAW